MRVERQVVVPVAPAEVWEAVVDGDRLAAWLGGDADLRVDLDLEPGATGTVTEANEPTRQVRVDVVEPERRLRFQWWPEDGSGPLTEVELDLAEVGAGTRVRVIETFIAPAPYAPAPRRPLGFHLRAQLQAPRVLVDA